MDSRKLMLLLSACMSLLLLSSCLGVAIRDNEFCADEGAIGASCFHMLSDSPRDLLKPAWDHERFGMICETTDVFTNLKSAVESLCQNSGQCNYEQQKAVIGFFSKIDKVKAKVKK